MSDSISIKINWKKNIPFVLDNVLEVGGGIFMLIFAHKNSIIIIVGIVLFMFGIVQLVRKIKTFQLSETHLTIKRPLFPFKFAEEEFELQKIKLVEFKRVIKIGPYIRIVGKINGKDGGYMLAIDKQSIDLFENELARRGLTVSRENV